MWTRYGTGFSSDVAVGDVDGDGIGEAVVGGRGVGIVDPEGRERGHFSWVNKWLDANGEAMASDGLSVTEFELSDLNQDGALDVIAGTDKALFAMDGRTGRTLWTATDTDTESTSVGAWEIAVADLNSDGIDDVAFAEMLDEGVTAVDGRDGSYLWSYERPLGYVMDMDSADLNGDGFTDVVVAGQVEVGFEVHAISGLPALTGKALPLWVQTFPSPLGSGEGRPGAVSIAQVEPGLSPEVVVGGNGALAVLSGMTGLPQAERDLEGMSLGDVLLLDIDGDAALEIAAPAVTFSGQIASHSVEFFDSNTEPMASLPMDAPIGELTSADLVGGERLELIVGGGWQNHGGKSEKDGFVKALSFSDGGHPGVLWEIATPEDVDQVAVGDLDGRQTILLGQRGAMGRGSGVIAVAPDGAERWSFRTGGQVQSVAVADLDGDSVPEVIEGGDDASVASYDSSGNLNWSTRILGRGVPSISSVAAGDLVPGGSHEVIAGTFEFDPTGSPGRVHLLDASGVRLWSRDIGGAVGGTAIADLDGDGRSEAMVAAASQDIGSAMGVVALYDSNGTSIWEQRVPTGQRTSLSLLDVNDDGTKDGIVTRASVFHGGAVIVVDGRTGEQLWSFDTPGSINWADVTGDPADGVVAGDFGGTVYRFDSSDGAIAWSVDPASASWGGEWSVDADGDGVRDVLSASHEGAVRMLSGSDGSTLWTAPTEGNPGYRVATLTGGAMPLVAVGELGQGTYSAAHLLVLDAVTGERVGVENTNGPVAALATGDLDGDSVDEFVAAAGWQITALDVPGNQQAGPKATNLAFLPDMPVEGQYSDRIVTAARLVSGSGDPVAGVEVSFALGDDTTSAITDPHGVATGSLRLSAKPGVHELTASYAGSSEYAVSTTEITFEILREDTRMSLERQGKGNRSTLVAHLSDGDQPTGVTDRTVWFYSDGEPLGTGTTDSDGYASILIPPSHRGANRTYEVIFRGDDYYLSSSQRIERSGRD